MLRYTCPTCHSKLTAPDAALDKKGRCPRCGQLLRLTASPRDKTVLARPGWDEGPTPGAPDRRWHYTVGGVPQADPVSLADMKRLAQAGALGEDDVVKQEGDAGWRRAGEVPDLWPEVIPGAPAEAAAESAPPLGPSLIPCQDCGRPLSGDAEVCPNCGARSRWVHPQIARFLRRRRRFARRFPNLHVEARGYVLTGTSRREPGLLDAAANAVGGLGMIAPLTVRGLATVIGLSVAGQVVSQALRDAAGKGGQAFVIDFRHDPPAYETTDDDFWEDVLVFFGLVEPAEREERPAPPKPPPLACHKCYTLMDGPPDDGRCPHCGARLRWF